VSDTKITNFRELDAWQVAMDLAVAGHRIAGLLPSIHRFELGSQIRKAATSVPSNIAEGHANHGGRIFLRQIRIALGSLAELETHVELASRLTSITEHDVANLAAELARTGQLLHGLERALKRRLYKSSLTCVAVSVTSVALWLTLMA